MYAPFNRRKPIAVLAHRVGEGRYEIAVRSLMAGPIALSLRELALPGVDGGAVSLVKEPFECLLEAGERVRLLAGDDGRLAPSAADLTEVGSRAIPLGEPGRSMYREWAWWRRPREIEQIDSELRRLDRLPLCRTVASVARAPQQAGVAEDDQSGDGAAAE